MYGFDMDDQGKIVAWNKSIISYPGDRWLLLSLLCDGCIIKQYPVTSPQRENFQKYAITTLNQNVATEET